MTKAAESIEFPACFSKTFKVGRNAARQMLVTSQPGSIEVSKEHTVAVLADGSQYRIRTSARNLGNDEIALKARSAVVKGLELPSKDELTWIGACERTAPEVVLQSLQGAFRFKGASEDGTKRGLRTAQLGAVHAVLAHWTTDADEPATIVMPTGTGKTETMLALFAAERLERLLVLVPSDTLRSQIGGKFESLGVLAEQEVVVGDVGRPVVGLVRGAFESAEDASKFAMACNVLVATPAALFASKEDSIITAFLECCTHLFVDEAHHVEARTWRRIRDAFAAKSVLQFTATPYREDGQRLSGKQIYRFRLRRAQELGYFAPIDYTSIVDFAAPDQAIATAAIARLRADLETGLDHVLMARVSRIGRAKEILSIYAELAPDLKPVVLYSRLPKKEQKAHLEALMDRDCRVVVCVDMLGEGFDLPSLKIAAIHDPHKSLGVTLQYIGRFARAKSDSIGRASVFVGRPGGDFDVRLRRLYAEDADWNSVISDLSESATDDEAEVGEFEEGFSSIPESVPMRSLAPKMSTVVYRTTCLDWQPENVTEVHQEHEFLTWPVPVNTERQVLWFVVALRAPVRWGDLATVEQIAYHLYVAYWNREKQLLYINSSNTDSHHSELAVALAGASATRITGLPVYRVMHNLQRMIPTNIGLLDARNRNRRFSMLVGADVSDGFPTAEAKTKTQTNIFASGFENGSRVTIGASLKGRIWSYRVARSIKHWADWCDHVGAKVSDETISPEQVMAAFIRPTVLTKRPELVPLAVEWPWEMWLWISEEIKLSYQGHSSALIDAEIRVTSHLTTGPIEFEVRGVGWCASYRGVVKNEKLVYQPVGEEVLLERPRAGAISLSAYFDQQGPILHFEEDAIVIPPAILLKPERELTGFERSRLTAIDWTGVDLRKESQGPERDQDSVQARAAAELLGRDEWEIVIDDDGTGEIADLVAFRRAGDLLRVFLVHCKYSSEDEPGARVADLYEVCGQAQKSVRWRHYITEMFRRLIRRERRRSQRQASGLMVGDGAALYSLADAARLLRPAFTIIVAQPGLSKAKATTPVLHILGSTEVYLSEVAGARFEVLCHE